MGRSYTNGLPRTYAAEKLPLLRGRAPELMGLLRTQAPVIFPNADPNFMALALLGFTSFSMSWTENTTDGVLTQAFHEVGLFQTPAGSRGGSAPNARGNASYWTLADNDAVKRALGGHSANKSPNGWKTDHAGQVAVGLANLAKDEQSLRRVLRAGIAGDDHGWSHWRVFTMFTAFSRGPGQAARVLNNYANDLATTPESQRLRKLRSLVARDIESGASGIGGKHGKMGAAYAVVRSDQKLESAVVAGIALNLSGLGGFSEKYVSPADDHVEDQIARGAYILTPSAVVSAVTETVTNVAQSAVAVVTSSENGPKIAGALVLVASLGAVAAWKLRG